MCGESSNNIECEWDFIQSIRSNIGEPKNETKTTFDFL